MTEIHQGPSLSPSDSDRKHPAQAAWNQLKADREHFLQKGREVASLTIPFLIPPAGANATTSLPTPFQGVGAEGVNNLASRLVLTLFPPSAPFFRLVADPAAVRALGEAQGADPEEVVENVNADISVMEQEIQAEIESRSLRPTLFTTFRHLIVGGNYLLRWQDGQVRGFSLPHFCIQRDRSANILWIVTREVMSRTALPEGVSAPKDKDSVELFTAAQRQPDGRYRVWQEVGDSIFNPDTLDEADLPYIAPTMFDLDGESYGRGLGEHYLGDLISLEALARSIVQGSAAAAHILWLVNPNGFTKVSELQNARTGSYVPGIPSDVQALRLDKNADFAVTAQTAERIERKLYRVFLLNTAIQRDAERVTAEEIRYMAQQIEAAHGGTYSLMNEQLQLPIARRVMADMQKQQRLPELPPGVVTPKVITGLEGLGRSAELERLRTFLGVSMENLGADAVASRINASNVLTRIAAATGVDVTGLLKSDEQLQQEQQAAQQAALMQSVAAPAAGAATAPVTQAVIDQQLQQQQQQQQQQAQ